MLKLGNDIYIYMEIPDRLLYLYLDIKDFIKYRILKYPVQQYTIPTHLELIAHREEDGGIWVESEEMPSFVAAAKNEEELPFQIQEALLVYFEVPRYQAKQFSPVNTRVEFANGKKIVYQAQDNKINYA